MKKTHLALILFSSACIMLTQPTVAEAKPQDFYEFNRTDFESYQQFRAKYLNVTLTLSKCTSVDSDLTSEKQYRCLQNINNSLVNGNTLLYSKLDQYDLSDYTTGLDRGFSQALKGCDSAYATNLSKRFKNQILKCKLQLQLERINFIANRSLPYYKSE